MVSVELVHQARNRMQSEEIVLEDVLTMNRKSVKGYVENVQITRGFLQIGCTAKQLNAQNRLKLSE